MKRINLRYPALFLVLLLSVSLLASCSGAPEPGDGLSDLNPSYGSPLPGGEADDAIGKPEEDFETPSQNGFRENPFVSTADAPVSTFSSDVDTASYAYFRKLIENGYSFDRIRSNYGKDIRTEEMLNYFTYGYTAPAEGDLFGVRTEIAPCPWNEETFLLMMNLTAAEAKANENGNNLVFLIDVSGSMNSSDKLPLLKKAFSCLVEKLTEKDRVSIVTYSGAEKVVLEACRGDDKNTILSAITSLSASGSTNGQAGIQKAYEIAESCKIAGGNNRIIMASDGDLNVGISSASELKEFIAEKRDAGIFLSVLGFGTGNYKDDNMEALADSGNGVYYYIDGEREAERIFGEGLLSTLYTVGKDVKLQLTFDPDVVAEYRLIGYENRILSTEDFEDDTKDAGEVGSGHTLTVCYELKPAELNVDDEETTATVVPLSYETKNSTGITLAVRWKEPEGSESILREYSIDLTSVTVTPSYEFRFAACVIETAMLLHDSEYVGSITLSDVIHELESMDFTDGDKNEFLALLKKAR